MGSTVQTPFFATPSFTSGAARVLDLGSTLNSYNMCKTAEEADARATRSDWNAIFGDVKAALTSFAASQNVKK